MLLHAYISIAVETKYRRAQENVERSLSALFAFFYGQISNVSRRDFIFREIQMPKPCGTSGWAEMARPTVVQWRLGECEIS